MIDHVKTYSELITIPNFVDRYRYLRVTSNIGDTTFGSKRYLNQLLYQSGEWKSIRNTIIVRDNGCDLGCLDREIHSGIVIHHIDPITIEDILERNPKVFDPNNLISASNMTHKAVHYGNENLLIGDLVPRRENDTCPWRH